MRFPVFVAALAAAVLVAACGTSAGKPADVRPHNAADVTFAQNMIPHHQQAVDMAAMVPTRTTNPDMIVLAKQISADQQAEIRTMTGLLDQWGEPLAPDHSSHSGMSHDGMAHGGMTMNGMVDDATMTQLASLDGAAFDSLWVKAMISHHQGAVTMAQTEIANGQNPDAVGLAKIIVTTQQREIAYMSHLLTVTQ
jgi:uncharacterized protein (DUF305 family)